VFIGGWHNSWYIATRNLTKEHWRAWRDCFESSTRWCNGVIFHALSIGAVVSSWAWVKNAMNRPAFWKWNCAWERSKERQYLTRGNETLGIQWHGRPLDADAVGGFDSSPTWRSISSKLAKPWKLVWYKSFLSFCAIEVKLGKMFDKHMSHLMKSFPENVKNFSCSWKSHISSNLDSHNTR